MLKEVYHMQRMFNNKVIGFDILGIDREEDRIKWFRSYMTAYDQELKELLESLHAGRVLGAGKEPEELDIKNIKIEIVDMLHFLVSMFQVIGEKEVENESLDGRPGSFQHCFEILKDDFKVRQGATLTADTGEQVNSRLIFISIQNLVSLGRLLDCLAWKWWARQKVSWDKVRTLLYGEIFPQWCMMAMASGMSAAETEELYFKKNKLNFERQQKGYKEGTYKKVDEEGKEDNLKLFK